MSEPLRPSAVGGGDLLEGQPDGVPDRRGTLARCRCRAAPSAVKPVGASDRARGRVQREAALAEMLADHCSLLYNGAPQERRDAYRQRHASRTSVQYGDQSAQLREIRAFDPERQGRGSFSSQQATLRRLDKAFAAFFRVDP